MLRAPPTAHSGLTFALGNLLISQVPVFLHYLRDSKRSREEGAGPEEPTPSHRPSCDAKITAPGRSRSRRPLCLQSAHAESGRCHFREGQTRSSVACLASAQKAGRGRRGGGGSWGRLVRAPRGTAHPLPYPSVLDSGTPGGAGHRTSARPGEPVRRPPLPCAWFWLAPSSRL